jgi:hypothetical protein
MMEVIERQGDLVEVRVSGKLQRADYARVVPQLESAIERGPLRLLVELHDFEGWAPQALVDDLRFDLRHRDDFARIAVVGEAKLEALATQISKPIFRGETRFFEDLEEARRWLRA